ILTDAGGRPFPLAVEQVLAAIRARRGALHPSDVPMRRRLLMREAEMLLALGDWERVEALAHALPPDDALTPTYRPLLLARAASGRGDAARAAELYDGTLSEG